MISKFIKHLKTKGRKGGAMKKQRLGWNSARVVFLIDENFKYGSSLLDNCQQIQTLLGCQFRGKNRKRKTSNLL